MYRSLSEDNIDAAISNYLTSIAEVGASVDGLRGIELFTSLKRARVESGPYPHVTLFEAANRIMTDLVILYGVRWLLRHADLPFTVYDVEYGHENASRHDVMAATHVETLHGEAFNVAPSFFPVKRASALAKLRRSEPAASYAVLLVNSDAVRAGYEPRQREAEHIVLVDIVTGEATVRGADFRV